MLKLLLEPETGLFACSPRQPFRHAGLDALPFIKQLPKCKSRNAKSFSEVFLAFGLNDIG